MAFRCCFQFFYSIYNSRIGRWFHNCMISNRHHRRLRSQASFDHSHVDKEIIDLITYKVKIVPIGRTNYSYFIQDTATNLLAVVDPGDAIYLHNIAKSFFQQPISIVLLTHKHWDHSAGILYLSKKYPNLKVCCSDVEQAYQITTRLKDGQIVQLGQTSIKGMSTPVHTKGSMCFYIESNQTSGSVFTGDTFFLGGMGAFFEGDLKSACNSISKFIGLPDQTLMFPGHEYSDTTLKFAMFVQPNNRQLLQKVSWVVKRRARYMVTIPSKVKEEKQYNPFIRIYDPSFYSQLGVRFYLEALAKLQELRMRKRNEYRNVELKIISENQIVVLCGEDRN